MTISNFEILLSWQSWRVFILHSNFLLSQEYFYFCVQNDFYVQNLIKLRDFWICSRRQSTITGRLPTVPVQAHCYDCHLYSSLASRCWSHAFQITVDCVCVATCVFALLCKYCLCCYISVILFWWKCLLINSVGTWQRGI